MMYRPLKNVAHIWKPQKHNHQRRTLIYSQDSALCHRASAGSNLITRTLFPLLFFCEHHPQGEEAHHHPMAEVTEHHSEQEREGDDGVRSCNETRQCQWAVVAANLSKASGDVVEGTLELLPGLTSR